MGGGNTKPIVIDKFPKLGIRISFLDEFIEKAGGRNMLNGVSTATVCEKIVKPMTDKEKSSLCSLLLSQNNPLVGQANVLIIHSYQSIFIEVVDIIKLHFINQPDIIIWFDLFSLDLHKEIDNIDEFCYSYNNTVKIFNYAVLVLPNWSKFHTILSRLWCNYELFCSYENKIKFEIAMNNEQQVAMNVNILYDTINTIDKIKSYIDCENCSCFYVYKDRLFKYLNKIGYTEVNDGILNLIRDTILNVLNKEHDDNNINEKDKMTIKYAIAHIFRTKGENFFEDAESCYLTVLESRQKSLGNEHPDTIHTQFSLASLYDDNDEFAKAEKLYNETLEISKKVLTDYHPMTLGLASNLASLYMHQPGNVGLIKVKIDQLYINEVEDNGSYFDKQDPALIIKINEQSMRTKRIQEGGTTSVFPEIFEVMANYSDEISVQVVNMDGFGLIKGNIGYGKIKIYKAVPDIDDGQVTCTLKLKNSKGINQGICTMRISCEPFNVSSVKLFLDHLSVTDVEDAGHMLDKQDPALKIFVGNNSLTTERIQEGGTSASFPEMFEVEKAKFSEDIIVQVVNMDGLGLTKKTIGNGKIKIYQAIPTLDEYVNFSIELTNSKDQPQGIVELRGIATMVDDVVVDVKGIGYDKAEHLWIECLTVQLELLGNNNLETLKTFESLACLYHKMKKYDKVIYMLEQSLDALTIMYGADHDFSVNTMESLAAAFVYSELFMKAEPLYSFVLDRNKKKYGDESPITLNSMEALAVLYVKTNFSHAARPLLEKILEKRKSNLGTGNWLTLRVMGTLADLYKEIGENFLAETLYLHLLEKYKETRGEAHPATLNLHHIVATFYAYKKGDLQKAHNLLLTCLDKQKEIFGDDHHPSVKNSQNALEIVTKKIKIKQACYD